MSLEADALIFRRPGCLKKFQGLDSWTEDEGLFGDPSDGW